MQARAKAGPSRPPSATDSWPTPGRSTTAAHSVSARSVGKPVPAGHVGPGPVNRADSMGDVPGALHSLLHLNSGKADGLTGFMVHVLGSSCSP